MTDLPHIGWPFRFGGDLEQNSDAERMAAAAVIACTPRGHFDHDPGFGATQLVFQQGPLDLERLAADIAQSDDRLQIDAEELLDLAAATARTVRATVNP